MRYHIFLVTTHGGTLRDTLYYKNEPTPQEAMRKARELCKYGIPYEAQVKNINRRDIYKLRKVYNLDYPKTFNVYMLYIHSRKGGVRKVTKTNYGVAIQKLKD
jgi:hypothetical protein